MPIIPKLLAFAFMGVGFYLLSFDNLPEITIGLVIIVIGAGLLMIAR
jgi:multisubunit Na+/H+ antiporter MnhC subunit